MSRFNQVFEAFRLIADEEKARKIADVITDNELHKEDLLPLATKKDISDVRVEVRDLEIRLINKYNLNTTIIAALTLAAAAFHYFTRT